MSHGGKIIMFLVEEMSPSNSRKPSRSCVTTSSVVDEVVNLNDRAVAVK
jgi:hypothetical protein